MNTREFEGKKLLILGGISSVCDIVIRAQIMGAYVIVADYLEDSPAKKIADEAVLLNALDVDAIVEYCKLKHVDGVLTGFVDILLEPCYQICEQLGLPCYMTPKMISMSTNKIDFKETCKQHNVPVPQTYLIGSVISDSVYENIKYPVFVKPMDASGSRGCGVCYNREELDKQFSKALSFSSSKNAIIEDYLTGREFLLSYIAEKGEYRFLEMYDRYATDDRGSAMNFSDISLAPAPNIDTYLTQVNERVIAMFKSLGFDDGLIFLQGYTQGDRVTLYEMGCRLGGAYYNLEQACLGYNAVDMVVRYALTGKMCNIEEIPVDCFRYNGKYALDVNFLLKGNSGTVSEIKALEEITSLPSCANVQKFHDVGFTFSKERIVDVPITTFEIVCSSEEDVINQVSYINQAFDVIDSKGDSMLYEKFNPVELF